MSDAPQIEVVAEAAEGYAGDWPKESALIDFAAGARADAIKFQLVFADELCTPDYKHYALVKSLELPASRWRAAADRAHAAGIRFYLDVFGDRGLGIAEDIGCDAVKLHSSDTLNTALIDRIAASPIEHVMLSAGGNELPELAAAIGRLTGKQITLMHGFQAYTTANEDNQLARLALLAKRFPDAALGFADHSAHDDPARMWLAAVAVGAGATVIEKHLTTAIVARDPDHYSALGPDEFATFAAAMRVAGAALGTATDEPTFGMTPAEQRYRKAMKKQVVAARDLAVGEVLHESDLVLKRTSQEDGVLFRLDDAIGRRVAVSLLHDHPVTEDVLE